MCPALFGLWPVLVFCLVIRNTGARTLDWGSIGRFYGRGPSRNCEVQTWICVPDQNYVCKFLNFLIKIVKQLLDFLADKNLRVVVSQPIKMTQVMKQKDANHMSKWLSQNSFSSILKIYIFSSFHQVNKNKIKSNFYYLSENKY